MSTVDDGYYTQPNKATFVREWRRRALVLTMIGVSVVVATLAIGKATDYALGTATRRDREDLRKTIAQLRVDEKAVTKSVRDARSTRVRGEAELTKIFRTNLAQIAKLEALIAADDRVANYQSFLRNAAVPPGNGAVGGNPTTNALMRRHVNAPMQTIYELIVAVRGAQFTLKNHEDALYGVEQGKRSTLEALRMAVKMSEEEKQASIQKLATKDEELPLRKDLAAELSALAATHALILQKGGHLEPLKKLRDEENAQINQRIIAMRADIATANKKATELNKQAAAEQNTANRIKADHATAKELLDEIKGVEINYGPNKNLKPPQLVALALLEKVTKGGLDQAFQTCNTNIITLESRVVSEIFNATDRYVKACIEGIKIRDAPIRAMGPAKHIKYEVHVPFLSGERKFLIANAASFQAAKASDVYRRFKRIF